MILEILKNCGVEEEKANDAVKAMAEAKIYTTNLENVDVRYNKLQEQKKQLEEASKNYEKQLKDLTKNNADVEALNKLVEQLQLSNKELEDNHSKEMYNLQFNFALENALNSAKSKNNKALKALLNMDSIKYQEVKLEGLQEQIEVLKNDASYLFDLDVAPASTGGVGNFGRGGNSSPMTKEQFRNMSYMERMDLYNKDKDLFNQLNNN
jgi:predicted RNase H-like nuclease (RuvC/YqgF family)